jgi:hypothetical protein
MKRNIIIKTTCTTVSVLGCDAETMRLQSRGFDAFNNEVMAGATHRAKAITVTTDLSQYTLLSTSCLTIQLVTSAGDPAKRKQQ